MKINNNEEFLAALVRKTETIRVSKLRWVCNPDQIPEKEKLYEKAKVNLFSIETEIATTEYLKENEGVMWTEKDPKLRKLLLYNKEALEEIGDYDLHIVALEKRRELCLHVIKELDDPLV